MEKKIGFKEFTGDDFQKDFEKLLSLSDSKLALLSKTLPSGTDFGFKDEEENRKVILKLNIPSADTRSIFSVCKFIFNEVYTKKIKPNDLISELREYARFKKIKNFENKAKHLKQLFTIDDIRKSKNIEQETQGVIDNLASFSCVFDLRHIFNEEKGGGIDALVPILIFRYLLKDDKGNKKAFSFQVDEEAFKTMLKGLKEVEKKLTSVKTRHKV